MTAEFDPSRPTGGASSGLSLRAKGVAIISLPIVALFVAMFAVRWMGVESVSAEQAIEREYRNHFTQLGLPFDRAEELRLAELLGRRDSARRKLSGILVCCGILGPLGALFMHLLIADKLAWRLRAVQENARRLAHGLPLAPFPTGTDEIAKLARQLEDAAYLMRGRERELRESESRFRDLFDRAPIPYEETDAKGVIRRFNQEVCEAFENHARPYSRPQGVGFRGSRPAAGLSRCHAREDRPRPTKSNRSNASSFSRTARASRWRSARA